MLRGNWHGQTLGSGSDGWKYWAELRAGNDHRARLAARSKTASPARAGTCMTMGTASTMTGDRRGAGPRRCRARRRFPASDSNHPRMATACGRRIVEMVWEDLKPRDLLTRKAFENAVTFLMAGRRIDQRRRPPDRHGRPCGPDADARRHRRDLAAHADDLQSAPVGPVPDGGLLLRRRHCARCWRSIARSACTSTSGPSTGATLGEDLAGAEVYNADVIRTPATALVCRGRRGRAARQPRARRRGR